MTSDSTKGVESPHTSLDVGALVNAIIGQAHKLVLDFLKDSTRLTRKKGSGQAPSKLSANDAMRGITYCTDRRWMTDVQLNLLLFSSSALLHLGSGPCLRRGTRSWRTVCSHAPLHQQHDMPGIPILRIPVSRVGCWCKIKSCPGLINLACTLFVSPF